MDNIEFTLKKIVAEQLHVKLEQISNNSKFIDDLGGDSLDTVEMVLTIEDELGVHIPDEIAENLTTVQEALDYITKVLQKT